MFELKEGLKPRLRSALAVHDPLAGLIAEPCPGVFVFDAFTPAFCERLLRDIEQYPSVEPNSMNRYGTVLKEIGLGPFGQRVLTKLVSPLARRCYPRFDQLRHYHGFVVNYDMKKQRSLDPHLDESDVTLNVCLGREFTGGKLIFRDEHDRVIAKLDHEVGQAVLHLGTQLHQAENIKSGKRSNLILWCTAALP